MNTISQVIELKIVENYTLWLKFKDGLSGEINLRPFLGDGLAKDLLERSNFETVGLEHGGGISFSNGYDFCPNFLRMLVEEAPSNCSL
ncbi:MAG: DUF2442 domain-containing protein [Ekhidna sp.]|nr:DUF2442 domain-containing protein [Ekhidna sp.]